MNNLVGISVSIVIPVRDNSELLNRDHLAIISQSSVHNEVIILYSQKINVDNAYVIIL